MKYDVIRLPHRLQQKFLTLQKSLRIKIVVGVLKWFFSTLKDRIEADIAATKKNCIPHTKLQLKTRGSISTNVLRLDLNVPFSKNNEVSICDIVYKEPYFFIISELYEMEKSCFCSSCPTVCVMADCKFELFITWFFIVPQFFLCCSFVPCRMKNYRRLKF